MVNDLGLTPDDLAHLPGAPFTQEQVDTALATVRLAAGWHIAPRRSETFEMDVHPHWWHLQFPTLLLVSVDEIRDADTGTVVPESAYRVSRKLCSVKRCRPWCYGYETVEADITHGHEVFPPALLPVLAGAAVQASREPGVASHRLDDFAQSFGVTSAMARDQLGNPAVLAAYSLDGGRSLYGLGIA